MPAGFPLVLTLVMQYEENSLWLHHLRLTCGEQWPRKTIPSRKTDCCG
jgi:hypothetical protein